ncbi:MAG: c-type cytochrome [Gammaproteobacteria bacterium]|nr:c-type cytochrome [Gammaproteobacteria bacterium]
MFDIVIKVPIHIIRLILLIGVVGGVAIGAKVYFTPESFGDYGHYRADSVAEIAAATPIYQGSPSCKSCHSMRHTEWSANIHKAVACETCHGAAGLHPDGKPPVPSDTRTHSLIARGRYDEVTQKLSIPTDTVSLCTLCHAKMPARPTAQRQIEVSKHAGTQQCIVCHNPHSPRIAQAGLLKVAQAGSAATGRAKASSCASCHGATGISSNPAWPNLAGQQQAYLVNALKAYRAGAGQYAMTGKDTTGVRQDPMMTGLAKDLSDTDINNLAAYYASLGCETAGSGVPVQDVAAGQAKAAVCSSCHGATGISSNPAWPNLARQQQTYLVNALKAYRAGAGQYAMTGKDTTGVRQDPMMTRLAKDLTDKDINNLAAYYASSSCK